MKVSYQGLAYGFKHWKGQPNGSYKSINLHKNYYRILQINQNAPQQTIKKSYLQLAKQHHPDVNPSGHTKFTEVQQAYNILSNSEFRNYYNSNSEFVTPFKKSQEQDKRQDPINYRNKSFYESMKTKGFQDFNEQEYQTDQKDQNNRKEQKEEESEDQRTRQRIEDEINLTRKILFTHNPIWERANAYMNYEQRFQRSMKKQKDIEDAFPKTSKAINTMKKWFSKY